MTLPLRLTSIEALRNSARSDLLSRLTLDEKIGFLHQFTPAVERLGIAAFRTGC
ncbi:hypothetical protein ACVB8X_18130 [Streptomyces sp. NRAIS4]